MEVKDNKIKCEVCSHKAGRKVYFFSRVYAEHGRKPVQCPRCKRVDWEKPRVKYNG